MVATAIAVLTGSLAWHFGVHQFPGYDASPLIDLAWRQFSGLRAHEDFFSPFPPTFGYPLALAFTFFGVKWSSAIAINAVACGLIVSLGIVWWSRLFGLLSATIVFGIGALQTMVFAGFWWHNTLGTMMAILAATGFLAFRKGKAMWPLVALVTGLAMVSKPNCTWPVLAAAFITSLRDHRSQTYGSRCGALWVFSILIAVAVAESDGSAIGYFRDLASTVQQRGDLVPGWKGTEVLLTAKYPASDIWTSVLLVTSAALALLLVSIRERDIASSLRPHAVIRGGLLVSFIASLMLNSEEPIVSWPLLTAALLLQPAPSNTSRRPLIWLATAILLIPVSQTVAMAHARERVRGAGEGNFWQIPEWSAPSPHPFFSGTVVSRRLIRFSDEVSRALTAFPGKSVFFGPRVEFGYAAWSRSSAEGLPLWWDRHQSWPFNDAFWENRLRAGWAIHNLDILVFVRNTLPSHPRLAWPHDADMYDIPDYLRHDFQQNYCDASAMLRLTSSVILVRRDLVVGRHVCRSGMLEADVRS